MTRDNSGKMPCSSYEPPALTIELHPQVVGFKDITESLIELKKAL
jgi:hypothetical protein